jgi:hypothetical protein
MPITKKHIKLAYMLKEARQLGLKDVENVLSRYAGDDVFLGGDDAALAEEKLDKAKSESFSLRHPYLTGLPTLGIASTRAKVKALEKIFRGMMRDSESVRNAVNKIKADAYDKYLKERELQVESDKANKGKNTVRAAGSVVAPLLTSFLASRERMAGTPKFSSEQIKQAAQILKRAGETPGIPDGSGPHGRGMGPGKGKADGSALRMSKDEFIKRYLSDVPEDERQAFIDKYFG